MAEKRRTIRRSQTLSPFGVGAIYDILGESLVAADTTTWPPVRSGEEIEMPRLAATLHGVRRFRTAPPAPSQGADGRGLRYVRFPRWMFCQRCRAMRFWTTKDEAANRYDEPRCSRPACTKGPRPPQLTPMRWVQICVQGHLDDVDWSYWVHGPNPACRSRDLEFISGQGTSLASLRVGCRSCRTSRDLEELPRLPLRCRGLQPWQRLDAAEHCQAPAKAVQRGGSNVHFPLVASALDIPPWSKVDIVDETVTAVRHHEYFQTLDAAVQRGDDLMATMALNRICTDCGVEEPFVRAVLANEGVGLPTPEPSSDPDSILKDEWTAFLTPVRGSARDHFITHAADLSPDGSPTGLAPFIDRVVVADRLREVRALVGFTRLDPNGRVVPPDLGGNRRLDWLPAVEVFGEGIFISLDEGLLRNWERQTAVAARAGQLEDRRKKSDMSSRLKEPATPRLIALHTLAHLLIRQLAFECGYSSASLRERLYAAADGSTRMAGILIYTASGDSEGTLGGLARQGEPPRLHNTILSALNRAMWCSTDPICIESTGQGMNSLNLGACHGCSLVPETSCVAMNSLLDRGLLVGWQGNPEMGLFSNLVGRVSLEGVA